MNHQRALSALSVAGLALALVPAAIAPAAAGSHPTSSVDAGQALSVTGVSARAKAGSLAVSPSSYVAGQALRFTGSLGKGGKRRISMQLHMGRPGDAWFPVRYFSDKTNKDGSFDFKFPAPGMRGIRYRVVAKGAATPPVGFSSQDQEVSMRVAGTDPAAPWDDGHAVAGQPFTVAATTTPALPALAGRGLTLQSRVDGDTWRTEATTTVQADGMGYFTGITAPAGTVVYRVKQEDVLNGANEIGWTQSYPTYVTVYEPGTEPEKSTKGTRNRNERSAAAPAVQARRATGASAIAASRYGWFPSLYDYTWEAGQSLTSPPDLGSDRKGFWQDYSDGTGRVGRLNGGLHLESGPAWGENFGTTRATLLNTSQAYGRWETRLRLISLGNFAVRVELVPERASDYDCGKRNITIAEVRGGSNEMTFGAKNGAKAWSGTRRLAALTNSPALAVEVNKDHITWFLDSRPIGSVKRKAVSGVPLTMRFSVVGDQAQNPMRTSMHSDWQRAFGISRGKQVKSGPKLRAAAAPTCDS